MLHQNGTHCRTIQPVSARCVRPSTASPHCSITATAFSLIYRTYGRVSGSQTTNTLCMNSAGTHLALETDLASTSNSLDLNTGASVTSPRMRCAQMGPCKHRHSTNSANTVPSRRQTRQTMLSLLCAPLGRALRPIYDLLRRQIFARCLHTLSCRAQCITFYHKTISQQQECNWRAARKQK